MTADELLAQIKSLNEQLMFYTSELGKLFKRDINYILKRQLSFVNSLGIISSTIASFSLLLFQTSFVTRPKFLLFGFSILISNVFFNFFFLRVRLASETKSFYKLGDIFSTFEEIDKFSETKGKKQDDIKILERQSSKLISALNNLSSFFAFIQNEDKEKNKRSIFNINKAELFINSSLFLLFLGIFFIICSFALDVLI
jgi:hypothetical protein